MDRRIKYTKNIITTNIGNAKNLFKNILSNLSDIVSFIGVIVVDLFFILTMYSYLAFAIISSMSILYVSSSFCLLFFTIPFW